MSKNVTPRTLDSRQLARFHAVDPGDEIVAPVWIEDEDARVATEADRLVPVLGIDVGDHMGEADDGKYLLQGTIETYATGVNSDVDYLVLEDVDDLALVHELDPETVLETAGEENQGDDSEKDSATNADSTGTDSSPNSKKRPAMSVGKEIRTDRGDERISGRNPFADPKRIKETGLHQGGN